MKSEDIAYRIPFDGVKQMIKKLIESHRFFVKESRKFVGKNIFANYPGVFAYQYDLKDKIYWPIAYCKFMWLCFKSL